MNACEAQKSIAESSGIQSAARPTAAAPAVAVEGACRFDARAWLPRGRELVVDRPGADGEAGEERGAERRRLATGEISTGRLRGVGERLHERGVLGHAAVDAQRRDRDPASASAASTRSAPRCAMPSSTARTISGRPVPRVSPSTVPRAP